MQRKNAVSCREDRWVWCGINAPRKAQAGQKKEVVAEPRNNHHSSIMLCPRLLVKVVRLLRISGLAGRSAGLVIGTYRPGRLGADNSGPVLCFC